MDYTVSAWWLLLALLLGAGLFAIGHRLGRHAGHREEGGVGSRDGDSAFYYRGINFLLADEPDRAIEEFVKAVRINSETVEIYLSLGNLFRARGEVGRAIRIHQTIIARPSLPDETRVAALYSLAEDYRHGGFVDRAVDAYRQVLAVDPGHHKALAGLQALHENEGRWDEALNTLQRLEKVTGKSDPRREAHLRLNLGKGLQRGGAEDQALEHYRAAIRIFPGCVEAHRLVGELLLSQGQTKGAVKSYASLKKSRPTHFFMLVGPLRRAYEQQEDVPGFEKCIRGAINSAADSPQLRLRWCEYLAEMDRLDEACTVLEEGVRRHPGSAELARMMMEMEARRGQLDEAVRSGILCLGQLTSHQHNYQCGRCGFRSHDIYWKCPQCHHWDTMDPL